MGTGISRNRTWCYDVTPIQTLSPFSISEESVSRKIRVLNSNKVAGPVWSTRKLLRLAELAIVSPLTKLYSMSIDKG